MEQSEELEKLDQSMSYLLYFWLSEMMSTCWRMAWLAFKSGEPIVTCIQYKEAESKSFSATNKIKVKCHGTRKLKTKMRKKLYFIRVV